MLISRLEEVRLTMSPIVLALVMRSTYVGRTSRRSPSSILAVIWMLVNASPSLGSTDAV